MALARVSSWRSLVSSRYVRSGVSAALFRKNASSSSDETMLPSDVEQATGLEKKELDALMAGVDDPFNMGVNKGPWGTKAAPTVVPSVFEERLVGCVCEEDATFINWMRLKKGPAQRCECGHWFQLVEGKSSKV